MIITKQEGEDDNNPLHRNQISTLSRLPSTLSSSRQWRGLENPRIVRGMRAFGGKDRHSKVSTIRGIKDRRIRLSSQTATQLYDLQHKLGLNQPSKVVDWLLDVTKNEIDNLLPLQIPPGGLIPQDYSSSSMLPNHTYERGHKTILSSKDDHQENYGGYVSHSHHHQLAPQNFSPLANQASSLQSLQNNINGLSYNPNFSLSQFESHSFDSQIKNDINITNNNNNSSSLALQPSVFSQNQLYHSRSIPTVLPSIILPPTYPPFTNISSSMENNEQSARLSGSSSSSQHVPNLVLMPAWCSSLDWFSNENTCFSGSVDDHQHDKKG